MLDRKKKLNGNGENQARSKATLLENGAANWYCGFPSFSPYSPSGAAPVVLHFPCSPAN